LSGRFVLECGSLLPPLKDAQMRTNQSIARKAQASLRTPMTSPFDPMVAKGQAISPVSRQKLVYEPVGTRRAAYPKQFLRDRLVDHPKYIYKHGEDLPEIRNW
jgi:phosphoketolase